MIIKYKSVYLIVVYNKTLEECDTITSFFLSSVDGDDSLVLIWNNGPENLVNDNELSKKGFRIEVKNTIENRSLSSIYNSVIKDYMSERYIILDDDTHLNDDYLSSVSLISRNEIGVPLIINNHKCVYPTINGATIKSDGELSKTDKVFTVMSGLVLGRSILLQMKMSWGDFFDERFILYGVDTSFFFRVYNLKLSDRIRIIQGFEHSLSTFEKESCDVKIFREVEKGCALGLIFRYYYPLSRSMPVFISNIIHYLISLLPFNKKSIFRESFIKSYFLGRHFRSDKG